MRERTVPRTTILVLTGLWAFHTLANWVWLSKNVMTRGWDRIGALINSLFYYDTLSTLSWQALFKATVQDDFRPPLFGVSMALMYKLFGVSPDVAVMVNAIYWIILLVACYGIGSRLGGQRLGLLSAVLVALLPLVYAMSRYSYFEFALTALVAMSLYLFLAGEGFTKRRASLLLGLSLGLGMLLKRTFPVFVIGAGTVVFFQAGLPRRLWRSLRSLTLPRLRDVGLALGGGLLLSALWYWPNQDLAQTLPAGVWMFPVWWLLSATTIYLLLQPATVVTNFLSSMALGISLASLWYLPRADFVQQILRIAWGVHDPRGRTVDLGAVSTYTEYLGSIVTGISPFLVLLLFLVGGILLIYRPVKEHSLFPKRWWASGWTMLIVSAVVAYLILSTSIYKEPRAITPLLPTLAVVLAGMLLALPWRWLRTSLIVLVVLFGVIQFFAVSFTETSWIVIKTAFPRPVFGQWSLFAHGPYLELPDSGLNDPGYYIGGDVLKRVEEERLRQGWDEISLGVLASSSHVHEGMFAYEKHRAYPAIRIENPVLAHPLESPYSMTYRYDYVLLLDGHNRGAAVRETVDLLLGERRSLFEAAFEPETTYDLPNGDKVYLYRRRMRPATEYPDASLYQAAEMLHETATAQDLVVVAPADMVSRLLEYYRGKAPVVPLDRFTPEQGGRALRLFLVTTWDADGGALSARYGPPSRDVPLGELHVLVFEVADS